MSQTAAMAALLCNTAGWAYLATLCESLSRQAGAGGRPELMPLLAVDGLEPCRARALYKAGFTTPAKVLAASEDELKTALSMTLPRSLKRQKGVAKKGTLAAAQVRCLNIVISCNPCPSHSVLGSFFIHMRRTVSASFKQRMFW